MRRFAIFLWLASSCAVSQAQELPKLEKRPESYDVVVKGKLPDDVRPFLDGWLEARRRTRAGAAEQMKELGGTLKIQDLSLEKLERRHFIGAFPLNGVSFELRADDLLGALAGGAERRNEVADEMFHVETIDGWLERNLDVRKRESLGVVEKWVTTRIAFSMDVLTKKIARQTKAIVTAETIDAKARTPVPGYEVMFVLELWEDYAEQHQPFPKLSTPTEHRIFPGRYVFYCRTQRDDGKVAEGPRRHIYVTEDTPFDLVIPK